MKVTKLSPQIKAENEIQVKKTRPARTEASAPPAETDRVELSQGLKEVRKMQEILQHTPEVRAEKVQAIKERIERGEYRVESGEIADRMLAELIAGDVTSI